jgi:hypothetical protein
LAQASSVSVQRPVMMICAPRSSFRRSSRAKVDVRALRDLESSTEGSAIFHILEQEARGYQPRQPAQISSPATIPMLTLPASPSLRATSATASLHA